MTDEEYKINRELIKAVREEQFQIKSNIPIKIVKAMIM